jgi:O-methyltransferase
MEGGLIMAAALKLKNIGSEDRELYLYDTFSGMSAPSDNDVGYDGKPAIKKFSKTKVGEDSSNWCLSPLEDVKKNVYSTGYKNNKIHFIKGKVEDTIPKYTPRVISLLRLDTDWYESTKHELIHLFPLLNKNGVLIIDDYGDWKGARKAVDEFVKDNNILILLNRVNGSRIGIKQ